MAQPESALPLAAVSCPGPAFQLGEMRTSGIPVPRLQGCGELLPHTCSPALQQALPLLGQRCHGSKSRWFDAAAFGDQNHVGLQFQPWTSSKQSKRSAFRRGNIARSGVSNTWISLNFKNVCKEQTEACLPAVTQEECHVKCEFNFNYW